MGSRNLRGEEELVGGREREFYKAPKLPPFPSLKIP
jgi:hypothetical protein